MRESSIVVGGCINGNRLNCVVGNSFLVGLNFVGFRADLSIESRVVTRAQIIEDEKGYKKYYCFCSRVCNMLWRDPGRVFMKKKEMENKMCII